jgi:hypothetical protein
VNLLDLDGFSLVCGQWLYLTAMDGGNAGFAGAKNLPCTAY